MKKILNFSLKTCIVVMLLFLSNQLIKSQIPYPNLIISGLNISNGVQVYKSPTGIISPESNISPLPVSFSNQAEVTYKAGIQITLNPGFQATSFASNGLFQAEIVEPEFQVVIFEPTVKPGFVGEYEKFEIGIKPPEDINSLIQTFFDSDDFPNGSGINPYDPEDINVFGTFHSPTGKIKKWNGFFYRDYYRTYDENNNPSGWVENQIQYPFRIRFAPDEIGKWTFDVTIECPSGVHYTVTSLVFYCEPSENPGYLEIGHHKRYLRFSKTKKNFFGIGENLENNEDDYFGIHPYSFQITSNWMSELSSVGGNLFGLALLSPDWAIERDYIGIYDKYPSHIDQVLYQGALVPKYHPGGNRQINAWEVDNIINLAKDLNLYIKFFLISHWAFDNTIYVPCNQWGFNPYKKLPGMEHPEDFFSNDAAKIYTRRYFRYIVARWGYSTNIAWYELVGEIDEISSQCFEETSGIIKDWFTTMGGFIKDSDQLADNHLISGAYSDPHETNPSATIFGNNYVDIAQQHHYGSNRQVNYSQRFDRAHTYLKEFIDKPLIYGEIGSNWIGEWLWPPDDRCSCVTNETYSSFHNAIWASSFMGTLGCGLPWGWRVESHCWSNPQYPNFKALSQFFKMFTDNNDFEVHKFVPKKWKGAGSGDNNRLENFWLINHSNDYGLGWVHNATSYWYNIVSQSCKDIQGHPPDDDWKYSEPTYNEDDEWNVFGLTIFAWYSASIYHAPNDIGDLIYDKTISTQCDLFGYARFSSDGMFSTSPDFGYKLYQGKKKSTNNPSSVVLKCPNDTIEATGIFKDDTLGKLHYFWNFGNGSTSNLWHPKLYYSSPGAYEVTLIIADSLGIIDTLRQTFIVPDSCFGTNWEIMSNNHAIMRSQENFKISIYPNPSQGIFHLLLDDSEQYSEGNLEIFTAYGSLVYSRQLSEQREYLIDLRSLSDGLYFISVHTGNHVGVIKLSKFDR